MSAILARITAISATRSRGCLSAAERAGREILHSSEIDIVEVISKYIPLKRLGSSYAGQCPFHATNTYDSFRVSPRLNIFKCFNCSESGGPVDFVMKIENVDYKRALEILDLREYKPPKRIIPRKPPSADKNQSLFMCAIHYWKFHLHYHREAIHYLSSRGIRDITLIKQLHLGYAPAKGLYEHLVGTGFAEELILREGLAKQGKYGPYDFFRDRIIFPVTNSQEKITTITSRSVDLVDMIKHLHLPGDIDTLYNENEVDSTYTVICEGIFDCLSLLQAGFNAVAVYGTGGLKPHMAIKLKKTEAIYLAFDKETNQAGEKGIERAMKIFRSLKITNVYPIMLPYMDGKKIDINDLFCKHGFTKEDFSSLMEDALARKNRHYN